MDDRDISIRNATFAAFVRLGRAPRADEVAVATDRPETDIHTAWRRLHDVHAIVLDGVTGAIRMASPFSAVPTPFRVEADDRSWYANCAWDAFGIGAALQVDSRFETTCPDCDEPIRIEVKGGRPDDATAVFHVLVPAADWWTDIGFT